MQFLNFFMALFLLVTGVISALAMWQPIGFLTAISIFDPAALAATGNYLMGHPGICLQLLAQYTNSILVSYKFFSLPAMWGVFSRVLNIVYVRASIADWVWWPWHNPSFWLAPSGGRGILADASAFGMEVPLPLACIHLSVWRNIAYTELGVLVVTLALFSPVLMASAAPEGFVTAMNYALKLSQVPEYLLSTQITLIVGIKLNELASKRDGIEFGRFYERMAGFMFWCCTPLTFILYAAAPDGLRILLLRGAYTEEALQITVALFQGLIVAFPAIIYNALLLQALAARQKVLMRNVMDITMCSTIFVGLWVLVPRVGLLNFPWIKTGCMYGVHFLWMLATRHRMPNVRLASIYNRMVLNVILNVGILIVCLAILPLMQDWSAWLRLAALVVLYALCEVCNSFGNGTRLHGTMPTSAEKWLASSVREATVAPRLWIGERIETMNILFLT